MVVWNGMVWWWWYGMVWYGRYTVVWYNHTKFHAGIIPYCTAVWYGMVWYHTVKRETRPE